MPCVTSTSALKKHVLKHAEVVKENSSAASASFIGKVFFSELETKMDRVRISAGRAGIVLNFIRFFLNIAYIASAITLAKILLRQDPISVDFRI